MNHSLPKHIGKIIYLFFKDRNWNQRINGYNILKSWEKIVPEKIFLNIKPIKIQNDTLFVRVKNHIWANELKIRKGEIINLINQKTDEKLIKNIIAKIDTRYFYSKNK